MSDLLPVPPANDSPDPALPASPPRQWAWRPKLRWFAAEIVVVVAGVLIALALNAWWGARQDAAAERSYLALIGSYDFNRIDFPDREQTFTAHVGRLRVRAALDTRWSLSSLLQLNSAADAGLANLRLRYNPREGSDFYLVINEGFNTNRFGTSPARPFTSQRTVLAKYTYTFVL